MLTIEQLKAMPRGTIFATGITLDQEGCTFITGSGKELRWVAVRGDIDDWCIYCHSREESLEWIRRNGDKIKMKQHIRMLVPCTDEAFKQYRY